MEKLYELKPVFVEVMPKVKEHGKLYISKRFSLCIHLCACGCGFEAVTPIGKGEWSYSSRGDFHNRLITLRPSIGNFAGEKPYHAHYLITDNKINWC